jgi:hypothetical protein
MTGAGTIMIEADIRLNARILIILLLQQKWLSLRQCVTKCGCGLADVKGPRRDIFRLALARDINQF